MKITMNKKHLLLVFVLCLIGGLFCTCHKEEIKEPTDYRDDCLGTYYCTGTSRGKSVVDTLKVVKITYNDDQIKITGKYINTRVFLEDYVRSSGTRHFELLDQTDERLRNYQGWFTDSTIHVYIYDRPELVGPQNVSETTLDGVKAK